MRKLARVSTAAVISLAALAAAPASSLAGTQNSTTISASGDADLQADGSATVTVTYSCMPGTGIGPVGDLYLDLEQTQGEGVSTVPANCNDQTHTTTIDLGPGPFVKGDAALSAQVSSEPGVATAQVEVIIH